MYYNNGLKIKTKYNVATFVDLWNRKKYENDPNSAFKNWKAIRASTMQRFEHGECIGYFAGTIECGEYHTVEKDAYGLSTEC